MFLVLRGKHPTMPHKYHPGNAPTTSTFAALSPNQLVPTCSPLTTMESLCTCPVCSKRYDSDSRLPKLLACGHTVCQPCLTSAGQDNASGSSNSSFACPQQCESRPLPEPLITNQAILALVSQIMPACAVHAASMRMFCVDCGAVRRTLPVGCCIWNKLLTLGSLVCGHVCDCREFVTAA